MNKQVANSIQKLKLFADDVIISISVTFSYCWGQKHCETGTGNRKILFGEGIQLTVNSSEYNLTFNISLLYLDVKHCKEMQDSKPC